MNICAELLDPAGLFCCFKHLPSAIQLSKEFLLQNSQMIYFGFGRLHYFTLHTDKIMTLVLQNVDLHQQRCMFWVVVVQEDKLRPSFLSKSSHILLSSWLQVRTQTRSSTNQKVDALSSLQTKVFKEKSVCINVFEWRNKACCIKRFVLQQSRTVLHKSRSI